MDRWKGRVALVTGASVGIGAAVAKELVRCGMKVVGCARNVDQIKELAAECKKAGYPGVLVPIKCDLTKEDDILAMFATIKAQHKGVDVLVNNAGLANNDPLLSGKTSGWKNMLDVNVIGLSICTREAYQSMKERNVDDGHIINLNSVAGHMVAPISGAHFYAGTKHAVTALTEGLRQELREAKSHIRATSISPGFVETEFADRFIKDKNLAKQILSQQKNLIAGDIAEAVLYVLGAPPHVQIGELLIRPVEQQM
ncbi:LOW QUALITY PROTEIN: dehydrogenase/reductase SDR family member 11-like [Acanthochromis polyacanthus]|uniref:LOW QUALITY PROTEIN: dehydrogenase/reductase SDR family member 11-like n=1 Tax=Acanthochromis polyacanthus TaxID=80966 RepID=UPI0022345E34|nr:LOW QUALITY PROTEIN: dehydrogenase/reductase SDR family member 11-like [Acanthochromis polyacanthus]